MGHVSIQTKRRTPTAPVHTTHTSRRTDYLGTAVFSTAIECVDLDATRAKRLIAGEEAEPGMLYSVDLCVFDMYRERFAGIARLTI